MGCIGACFGKFDLPIFKERLSRTAEDELAEVQRVNRHDPSLMLKVLDMPHGRLYWSDSHFVGTMGVIRLILLSIFSKISYTTHRLDNGRKAP